MIAPLQEKEIFMKSVLEELWYGNVCPNSGCRKLTERETALMRVVADLHEKLSASFTQEQKMLFEGFDECSAELTEINEREIFTYAFRLGAKLVMEIMDFPEDSEPQGLLIKGSEGKI